MPDPFVKKYIKTELIKINSAKPEPKKIRYAAEAIRKGKLVVFPTETVYGIAAYAKNKKTIERLRKLKSRPKNPFSFHIASRSDLKKLNCVIDKDITRLINKFWPGPLTLILKTKNGKAIGVRMPSHPVAKALLKRTGPYVVAPSANFKNQAPAITAYQAIEDLSGVVDIIIDSGKASVGISSTVLDMAQNPPKILRQGSVRI